MAQKSIWRVAQSLLIPILGLLFPKGYNFLGSSVGRGKLLAIFGEIVGEMREYFPRQQALV
jgi:hypothetical protein